MPLATRQPTREPGTRIVTSPSGTVRAHVHGRRRCNGAHRTEAPVGDTSGSPWLDSNQRPSGSQPDTLSAELHRVGVRANPMAIRTYDIALSDLFEQLVVSHVPSRSNVVPFLSANMVKVHDVGRKGSTTISTWYILGTIDCPLRLSVLRVSMLLDIWHVSCIRPRRVLLKEMEAG